MTHAWLDQTSVGLLMELESRVHTNMQSTLVFPGLYPASTPGAMACVIGGLSRHYLSSTSRQAGSPGFRLLSSTQQVG